MTLTIAPHPKASRPYENSDLLIEVSDCKTSMFFSMTDFLDAYRRVFITSEVDECTISPTCQNDNI